MIKRHIRVMLKAGLSLAVFTFFSVLFVSTSETLTRDKIAKNKAMMLLQALNEVVPPSSYNNDLIASKIILSRKDTGFVADTPVYFAFNNQQPVAAIFEATTYKGYSGEIRVLIGINASDQSITGVRVVNHNETPGLGDKLELRKSDWVLGFNGKSLSNESLQDWQVKKDGGKFDQFTGATITPRAIVNLSKSTLLYAQDHLSTLFSERVRGSQK